MTQPVKVYYVENQATKEIRKFSLESDLASNFEYVTAKIRQMFPDLLRKDIQIFWKDSENDYLTISSDEELHEALSNVLLNDGLLKLYVKHHQQEKFDKNDKEHVGVTCDGCENKVKGFRYKCTQCFDFDLCSNCESKNTHPSDHEMICIKVPRSADHYMRHPGFARGGCRRAPFGGRGPFHGRGKCGFKGTFPFGRMFHPFADVYYSQNQASEEKKEKSDKKPKDGEDSKSNNDGCYKDECSDMIEMLATTFGFDPEVAKLHFTSFCNDLKKSREEQKKQSEDATKEDNDANQTDQRSGDVDFQKETVQTSSTKINEDVSMECPQNEKDETPDQTGDQFKNELESVVGHFSEQFGLNEEAQQNIQGGLNTLRQGIFHPPSFQSQSSISNEKDSQTKQEDYKEPRKPDEFIFVDEEKEGEKSLTEDEKYQQRLDKALRQMENMGFDNEGGWLKQLLVSKDLSIGRVLDALNPSN